MPRGKEVIRKGDLLDHVDMERIKEVQRFQMCRSQDVCLM